MGNEGIHNRSGPIFCPPGKDFASSLNNYCRKVCDIAVDGLTGCNCDSNPPETTLPTVAFAAPAAGLVSVGVFVFFTTILGCVGKCKFKRISTSEII
jgi:hypothetical protein